MLFQSSCAVAAAILLAALQAAPVLAQTYGGFHGYLSLPLETVNVVIANPSADQALNDRITDSFRRTIAIYPGEQFKEDAAEFAIARARRNPDIANITYSYALGVSGGLDVTFTITLGKGAEAGAKRGYFASSNLADLPVLYDSDGTYIRAKFEALSLYYGNDNAWFGQPGPMLAGNPMVQGKPAGEGYADWLEGYVHYGVYGITPLSRNAYVYGGLSGLSTGSTGEELFTNQTRGYTWFEDAYAGLVTGDTDDKGNRVLFNMSGGRQRFTLANGFLIANTASNGQDRAALQSNARWAADMLALAQLAYNSTKLEAFYLDPDELPILESNSRFLGANLEMRPLPGLMLGTSYINVPQSEYAYYGPLGLIGTRQGLSVLDARFTWSPKAPTITGPFFGGEAALQTHSEFAMLATAGYLEAGYRFPTAKWSPAISYRASFFSGDDPDTETYERWDPLLSGGNGEQWVQGANEFKVVQDSNVFAQRLQASLRPLPTVEVVPQLWLFRADSEQNIGGNPALSLLDGRDYGFEANMTVKWFASRNWYIHGHVAYTVPGDAVEDALDGNARDWLSTMLFIRYTL